MINVTVYTSLDKGIEGVEAKAKELALLLSYYTGEKVSLNIVIAPLSSTDIVVPSVRVNEILFNHLDISEIIARVIFRNAISPPLIGVNNGASITSVV